MEKPNLPAETLDRIEAVYSVTATFVITAGVYSGVPDNHCLAQLINERGVHEDDIDSANIIEVRVDDQVIARATGKD